MSKVTEDKLRQSMHFPKLRGIFIYFGICLLIIFLGLMFKRYDQDNSIEYKFEMAIDITSQMASVFLFTSIILSLFDLYLSKKREKHFWKVYKYINDQNPEYRSVTILPKNILSKILWLTDGLIYRTAIDQSGKKYGVYQSYKPDSEISARLYDIKMFASSKLFSIHYVAIPEDFFK